VVGAGITGLSVANSLSRSGIDVVLVERSPFPGGRSTFHGCKATDTCSHCGVCLVRDALSTFRSGTRVTSYFSAAPGALRKTADGFGLTVTITPNAIDASLCTECGECLPVCPENAVRWAPGWSYHVDERCTRCGKCVDACPVGAIDPARASRSAEIDAGCIVVATGYTPFDPSLDRKWGYGGGPRVVTASDLERAFLEERYLPVDGRRIAFLQCVGSRNVTEGQAHCSRVCCAYALRMAARIKHEAPDAEVDIFYMDVQRFGKDFDEFYARVHGKVTLIRSNPIAVKNDEDGRPIVRYESMDRGVCAEKTYDLLVLSTGICPGEDSERLAALFDLDMADGRFLRAEQGSGIFVAGTAARPMGIEECVEDAFQVTQRAERYLGREPLGHAVAGSQSERRA
jgi:heterodisulfide reductase subunit A